MLGVQVMAMVVFPVDDGLKDAAVRGLGCFGVAQGMSLQVTSLLHENQYNSNH